MAAVANLKPLSADERTKPVNVAKVSGDHDLELDDDDGGETGERHARSAPVILRRQGNRKRKLAKKVKDFWQINKGKLTITENDGDSDWKGILMMDQNV